PLMKGGTTDGQCTVHRCAGPPYRVPGFDECDARRDSAVSPALRGGVPSPYGRGAPRWETPDGSPVCHVQKLPPADTRRSTVLHPGLPENLCSPGGARALVWHGPEQSPSVDARALAGATSGAAHPRRCPGPAA